MLSFEEIAALVRVFVALGVRRVRLTGGEPTVRRDLVALVRMLRAIPGLDDIALSTNGHLLPELAAPLRAAGVDRLNVSLDSLDAERFRRITRRGDLGARARGHRGGARRRLRVDQAEHRRHPRRQRRRVRRICAWAWERGLVPRFIEEMPMADGRTYLPGAQLSAAEIRAPHRGGLAGRARSSPTTPARHGGAGPARYFRLEPRAGGHAGVTRAGSGSSRR